MNMKQIFFSFFGFFLAFSQTSFTKNLDNAFAILSIPKSGTGLIEKCIRLLTHKTQAVALHTKLMQLPPHLQQSDHKYAHIHYQNHQYMTSHFNIVPDLDKFFSLYPYYKKIINIRDLRDVCISAVHYIDQDNHFWHAKKMAGFTESKNEWDKLTFDEKLLLVICAKNTIPISISNNAETALKFIHTHANVLVTRFENLVGPQGGGFSSTQETEIQNIAAFLNIPLTTMDSQMLAKQLFGNQISPSQTFREGKIGSWAKYFQSEHIQAFKKHLGQYLIALGYENDNEW